MKLSKAVLVFIVFFLISVAFSRSAVFAQTTPAEKKVTPTPIKVQQTPTTGINLSLSPTFLNLKTDPGESINSEFRVRNNNTFDESLKVSLVKFVNSDKGTPVITEIERGDEFGTWLKFDKEEFVLGPGRSELVKFTISPPKSASLGYYYAILVSRVQRSEGTGTVISGSTAVPVLLDVKSPNAKREVQIVSLNADGLFHEHLPIDFNIVFKNTGNVHTAPVGNIFIDSLFNKEVGVLGVNEGRGNILPGGNRTYTAKWDDGFAVKVIKTKDGVPLKDSKGNSVYETKFDFSKANLFRFGRYTANVLMVYDNGERDIPIEAKVSFWVIPWKIFLGGFAVIFTPALLVYLIMRWAYGRKKYLPA